MRSNLKFIFILFFLLSFHLEASTCYMSLTLKNPKLANNEKLWADFEKELKAGTPESVAIEKVYKKHSQENLGKQSTSTPAKTKSSLDFSISKKAQIELNKLPPNLRKKTDEFIELISTKEGFNELKSNPGRWNYEALNFAKDTYSVRLNGGYRVLFEIKNDLLTIKEINKNDIHKK